MSLNSLKKIFVLTKNEIYKSMSKSAVIAFLAVIVFGALLAATVLKNSAEENYFITETSWRSEIQDRITNLENYLNSSVSMTSDRRESYEDEIMIYNYCLANDIKPYSSHTASNFIIEINKYFMIIILLSVVIGTKIITDEYKNKAINNLLVVPASRSKILLSKILTVTLTMIVAMTLLFLMSIIMGWMFFGFDDFSAPFLTVLNGEVVATNILLRSFEQLFLNIFALLAFSSLGMLLSIIFKSNIVSILATEGIYALGSIVVFSLRGVEWLKYTIFPHFNIQYYVERVMPFNITPMFSCIVLLIYSIAFFASSFLVFNLRDAR
ncbi:MAG: ABC transporter permease [Christensenellaceae bacterium]|jgi:ABC-2 type transport system permease protein|nr:ABC transporter permease [Christensenellaceae bacterium]